jgi:hypothetical protein
MNMNAKAHGWEIDAAVKEKSEELVAKAIEAAKEISDKLDSRDKDFAKSQVRNLMVVLDREQSLGPVRLWMKYQEARKVAGWDKARPAIERLLDHAQLLAKDFGPAGARAAARTSVGFLIQALQFATYAKQQAGRPA